MAFGSCQNGSWKGFFEELSHSEAQQRYFSYRTILVAIVPQKCFVLVFMGYRTMIAQYVAAEWLRSSPARIGRRELLLPSPKTALPGGNRSPTGVPGIPWTCSGPTPCCCMRSR